jgi:hypothetical protein
MGVSVTLYIPIDVGQKINHDAPYWENEYHEFFNGGTTHNLIEMAEKAHLYNAIWRPYRSFNIAEEDEYKAEIHAEDLVEKLQKGFELLKSNPQYYKSFNSPNGWGTYDNFIIFVENYLNACKKYPKAIVDVSR